MVSLLSVLVPTSASKLHLFRQRSRGAPWSLTPYPYWILRQYNDVYIMSLIKLELSNTMLANDDGSLPVTADRFSDWLLINIPFEIQAVQKILSFPTTIQRCTDVFSSAHPRAHSLVVSSAIRSIVAQALQEVRVPPLCCRYLRRPRHLLDVCIGIDGCLRQSSRSNP